MLHKKLEMRSGQLLGCQMERLVRAFGAEALQTKTSLEERLQSSGRQWLDSVHRLHYRHVRRSLPQHGQRLQPLAVFRRRTKMLRLHSYPNQAKTLGMQKIGELSRCSATVAWAKASERPLPAVAEVCRPMPVWLPPRKEHARCSGHPGKRVREIHQLESPSKSPQLSPRRFLV